MEHIIPERMALRQQVRDLRNWQECLKRCNPAFAKRFIMNKLRPLDAISDIGTTWLFTVLNLRGEV